MEVSEFRDVTHELVLKVLRAMLYNPHLELPDTHPAFRVVQAVLVMRFRDRTVPAEKIRARVYPRDSNTHRVDEILVAAKGAGVIE